MKYALFEHNHGEAGIVNYGDHIQSLAAKQYYPSLDFFVERDELNKPSYESAKIIMNGWFTFKPENWPPNPNLKPLFVSFHLNPRFADAIFSKKENIAYFKKHEPIGCRDYKTKSIMEENGIKAYFSFCLTSTLDIKYKTKETSENIYFVDLLYDYDQRFVYKADPKRILYHTLSGRIFKTMNIFKKNKIIKKLIPKHIIQKAQNINHFCSNKIPTKDIYNIAEHTLKKYARAKIVVTSRIHCALPCLALGTPVLFVFNGLENFGGHLSRFIGTVNHLNILTDKPKEFMYDIFGKDVNVFHPNEIDWDNPPANPESFKPLAEKLKKKCRDFIDSPKV